jgi:hypothetical protein
MAKNSSEIQKQKLENVGYISLVDFLAQNNIDVKDIRSVFDEATKVPEITDIVGNFLNDQRIIDIFNKAPIQFEQIADYADVSIEEYGYESFEELALKVNKFAEKYPDKNLADPQVQRSFIEGYHQSHKELDILANKQHAGDRITATVSELVQNAIDATAQAKDPTITPIGKFGMGAKTMFGSMGVGDYLLLQSKDKTFFVIKTGEGVESLICSDKLEFINAQLAKRGDIIPSREEGIGTIATLSYAKSKIDDSIEQGIGKFRYNPDVSIDLIKNGEVESMNQVDLDDLKTTGGVRIKTQDYKDHKTINIEDEGNGFDPIKLFQTSTKNSEERYSKEFNSDSKAFLNPKENNDIIMLIQGTEVSIDTIKNKDRYIESTLTKGIVIENSGYLQTSESRSDWSVTDYTNQSLEFAFNNLLEDAPSKQEQANIINTLYLWYESLPQAKKLSLTPIKDLLVKQAQDVKQDSGSQFLPNLREFGQFDNGNTIFLHPDLIGTYSPENIDNAQFKTSKNGFAVWGVDMQVVQKDNIKLYEAIGNGESLQSKSQSKILKLDKSIPPQIWVDNQLLNGLEDLYKQEESAELINQYNYQVWLMNSNLNEIDNSYKAIGEAHDYFDNYETRKYNEEQEQKLNEELNGKEDINDLNRQYNIRDRSYLLNANAILDGKMRGREKKYDTYKHSYSVIEELDTGDYILNLGNEVTFRLDIANNSYTIKQDRGEAEITYQLPFKLNTGVGQTFLDKITSLKNGSIELGNSDLNNIIKMIFDNSPRAAFANVSDIINSISEQEEAKPDKITTPMRVAKDGSFQYLLSDDMGSIYVKPIDDKTIKIRYSKNGYEKIVELPMMKEDMDDLFGKELISTKLDKNLLSSLNPLLSNSAFEAIALDLINETMQNKVANGDQGQYQARFRGKSISIKNINNCDIKIKLDDEMNLILNFQSDNSKSDGIIDYKLGKLEDGASNEDFYRFTKFISNDNFVKVDPSVLQLIEELREALNNAQDEADIDNILTDLGPGMYFDFKDLFRSGINNIDKYRVNIRDNSKETLYALIENPTNGLTLDHSKTQKMVSLTFSMLNSDNERKQFSYQTPFDGEFNLGDSVNLAEVLLVIDRAMQSVDKDQGEEATKIIFNALVNKYATVNSMGDELQTQELENKTELLNEFAKVGSKLEALKEKLNYSYDSQLMGKELSKDVKTVEDAKLWLESNNEFINYIQTAGSSFENGLDEVSQDMVMRINRLKQNNFYIDNMDEAVSKTGLITHHHQALKSTEHLPANQKSGVLMALLSSEKTEDYDVNKFKTIIQNLAQIEQGLGQLSSASLDNVKNMLLFQFQDDKDSILERVETITNNITKIKNEKPELFDYIINKLTIKLGDSDPLIDNFFYAPFNVQDKDKALFRFLSTPDAVLLENNQMKSIDVDSKLTIEPDNFSLGELGFMGRSVVHADQLQSDSISGIQKNSKAQELSGKINKEINRLATSQVSGDKWGTVLRELFQNSKDSANKMNGVSNINFNQDIYNPEAGSWLGDNEFLRTEFGDDATGIPEFLFNYFNPMKSTKDIEDAISAGAFGCGAITINSIADFYEIKTKNKDEKEGFHIKVEVIKSKDGTQVIGTKVIELSRIEEQESGTQIRMYSKNTDKSVMPELQALISQGALVELSELEVLNNPNINLSVQGEQRKSPENARAVYQSDKVQFVEGVKPGYWVKNLFVSELNHDQNQFSQPLPEFLSTMLKDNPVAVNFQNKLELVRTRTGFSESGEKEAVNILTQEYMKYIATEMYNGSQIKIPYLDADLSSAYRHYTTGHTTNLADKLYNQDGLSLNQLSSLSNSQWIAMLLEAPIEVNNQQSSLKEMFMILEDVANQAQKQDISSQDKIEDAVKDITSKMDSKTKAIYDNLQKSKLTQTYSSLNVNSAINLGLSTDKIEETETILKPEDLPEESKKAREIFENVFNQLTKDLPISRFEKGNTDHRMVYVTREVGNDHSGQIKREGDTQYMLWKFDYKRIGLLGTKTSLSTTDYKAMFEVIVHEIAHQLEQVGMRKPGTHDQIFDELMKCNFARLLNQ